MGEHTNLIWLVAVIRLHNLHIPRILYGSPLESELITVTCLLQPNKDDLSISSQIRLMIPLDF